MMRITLIAIFIWFAYLSTNAQIDSLVKPVKSGIKLNIGNNPKNFVKLGFHTQLWARFSEYNPGTLDYDDNRIYNDVDFIMRRTAFTNLVVIDKFKFFTNLTVSSQSNTTAFTPFAAKSPQLYFYDIWASYTPIKEYLTIGGGLHMYNGISRYSSASSMKTLGVDVILLSAPNLLTTDQAARQMGLFATGNIKKVAYRFALNKPFATSSVSNELNLNTVYHHTTNNLSQAGYIEFQFWDKESNYMPFKAATYIGEKHVFNIGAGFYNHSKATISFNNDSTKQYHNIQHFAVDLFCDAPFNNNSAITAYAAAFWFNYGPNYLHSFGIQENFRGSLSEIQFGSGNAYLGQIAYLLPSNNKSKRIQPYYEVSIRDYSGLNDILYHHNAGINYFIIGHNLKLTLQYENRPFTHENKTIRKSMLIGKFQLSI